MNTVESMPNETLKIQTDRAEALERELGAERKRVAAALRETREKLGLSLRDVAPRARLSGASLSYIERGEQWHTPTIKRLARLYERSAA